MSDAPLLHYSTSTAPLQAGSPDKPAANIIDITVSSPAGQKIYCNTIDIAVPISAPDDAGAYFTENPQSSITGKWSPASAQMKTGQELGLAPATNYYHVIFQAPPIPGFDLIDKPLTISITGNVAATPGSTLTCPTTESSGTTSGKYTRKTPQELTWDTAEPVFYLHNFLASAPDKPTIPKTKFNAGDKVYFTWESNGDSYHLYDGDGTVLHEGSETSWTIPAGTIANDTTFTLKASKKNANGFETVDQYATITITITNPTLSQMTVTNGTHTPWVQGTVDGKEGRVTFSDAGVEVANNAGSLGTLQADKADLNGVSTIWVQGTGTNPGRISFPKEGLNVTRAGGQLWGTVFAERVTGGNPDDGQITFTTEGLNVLRAGGDAWGTVFADKANLNGVNTNWVQGKSTDDGWISFPKEGLHVYQGQGNQNWGTVAADKADLNTLKVKYL
ncbi:hypothetical protein GCM10022224_065170 [Nonomuraea antimicrobica]|uniref:Uncharacterized protein n=1 Tax=Nonomuraea antimicrobica TaxID=561173 RepID=A0ABP7CHI5_9ACTN